MRQSRNATTIIDYPLMRQICNMYAYSKYYVTMKSIGKKFGLTKNDVILIVEYAITHNVISDETTNKIISKVVLKSHNIATVYQNYLIKREENKHIIDLHHQLLLNDIANIEHIIAIYGSDFSDADELQKSNDFFEYKLLMKENEISFYEYYLYRTYIENQNPQ